MEGRSYLRLDEVESGINLIWNNKFDEADELFKTSKDKNARFALHYAESLFLKSFITADIEDTQGALNRLKFAVELAENQLKQLDKGFDPSDASKKIENKEELVNRSLDIRIAFADGLYMLAILQMSRDMKIKGAFNLRKSWKVFEKILKESKAVKDILHPELEKCIKFGAGFFLFAISIIPQKFMKFLQMAGFKADREAGLHYIREVQKSGGIRGPFATIGLLFNNLLLPRGVANIEQFLVEAEQLVDESLKKYPTGSLFHVMGSHCARKQINIEKGIKLMEIALDNSKHFKQPPLIYRYELANCYCINLKWEKAIENYLPLIDAQKFQVRTVCSLQLAACYFGVDQKEKAFQLLNKMQNYGGKKSSFDNMAIRQAKRYLANGGHFAALELLYLRRDLAKMIPIIEEVLKQLDEAAKKANALNKKGPPPSPEKKPKSSPFSTRISMDAIKNFAKNAADSIGKKKDVDYSYDDRACYVLLRGTILKSLNKHDEAIPYFQEVISMKDWLVEKFYLPYTLYELGESYFFKGMLKEAQEMMVKCSKISGYDWEDPLKIRLKVSLDQVKRGLNPQENQQMISIDNLVSNSLTIDDVSDMKEPDEEPEDEGEDGEEENKKEEI